MTTEAIDVNSSTPKHPFVAERSSSAIWRALGKPRCGRGKQSGRLIRIVTLCGLFQICATLSLFAQPDASPADELTLTELRDRLTKLRQDLDREKSALAASEQRNAAEIEELGGQRRALADRLISARIEWERDAGQLESLRAEAARVAAAADEAKASAASVPQAFREAAEQASVHLKEVPGGQAFIDKLRAASSREVWSEDANAQDQAASLADFFSAMNEAHLRATSVSVRQASIFTADGSRKSVKLLAIGNCRFAYETTEGHIGLALSSPRDTSGFRWSENLTNEQQALLREAIAAVGAGNSAVASIPLDPIGRIRPESLNQQIGLFERVRTGGLVMVPLAGLALVAMLLIGERFVVFYVLNKTATRRVRKVLKACEDADYATADSLCDRGGAVPRVLAACLRRRSLGQRAMEDSIQEQLLHELPRLQRFMGGIATLAAVAPLLGLLGTVTGIIRTFGVIRAFGNANPSLMAGGISEALMTTASGLVIAVPILIVHSVLRGRADRIVADAERYAANMLTVLAHPPDASDGDDADHHDMIATASDESSSSETHVAKGNGHSRPVGQQVGQEVGID